MLLDSVGGHTYQDTQKTRFQVNVRVGVRSTCKEGKLDQFANIPYVEVKIC